MSALGTHITVAFDEGPEARILITGPELDRLHKDDRALFALELERALDTALGGFTDFHCTPETLPGSVDSPQSRPGQLKQPNLHRTAAVPTVARSS